MLKRKFILLLILGFILKFNAQEVTVTLNDYKYVIVPEKFDFLKETNQYQLNSLTKFLFEKYGFTTVMDTAEKPLDYKQNNCLGLQSNVISEKGLFKTKLTVQLKNCNGITVFTSKIGETREKEFKAAYQTALRDAFTSFETVNYKYTPNNQFNSIKEEKTVSSTENTKEEIEKLKAEIEQLKSESNNVETIPVVIAPVESPQKVEKVESSNEINISETTKATNGILYAQATKDGYQLVDSTPKIVYKLKKTGSDTIFLVESINGVLTKKGDTWILEYYENGNLKQEQLSIKF